MEFPSKHFDRTAGRTVTRVALAAAAALATVVALAGCSGSGSAQAGSDGGSTRTVEVALTGIASNGGLTLGMKEGFFAKEGLKIKLVTVANQAAAVTAVQGGQVQLAYAPSIPVLGAASKGIPLRVVAAGDGIPPNATTASDQAKVDSTALYVSKKSGITSAKQLVGKTVAVPARGGQLEITIASAVKDAGGNPAGIKWTVLPYTSEVSSLKNGTIDAAGLTDPFTEQAASNGDKRLLSLAVSFFRKGATGLWVTSTSTAKDSALITKLQHAIYESNAYADSHVHAALQQGAELTKIPVKQLEAGATPYWPSTVSVADLQRTAGKMHALGYLKSDVKAASLVLPQPKK